jgi:hypothetical protein
MNENALRAIQSVNIEEFERRLRATGSLGAVQEDPLAELARLLGAEEPPAAAPEPAEPKSARAAPPVLRASRDEGMASRVAHVEFSADSGAPPANDEPAIEAPHQLPPFSSPPPIPDTPPPPFVAQPPSRPRRSRALPMAAIVVIGAGCAAGAWAYRSGAVPGLASRVPPLIMAATGPTKVQPPSEETVASSDDVPSLVTKDQGKSGPVSLVSKEEQPVDLDQKSREQAGDQPGGADPNANPPTIAAAPMVVVAGPSSSATAAPAPAPAADARAPAAPPPAAVSTAPAPSPVAPTDAPATTGSVASVGPTAAPPAPPPLFPEAKRVKTVSVRPDGSVISTSAGPAGSETAANPSADAASTPTLPSHPPKPIARPPVDAADAESATPKLDLPTKLSGKSTTRAPISKIDTTVTNGASASPEAASPASSKSAAAKKREAAEQHVAAADPAPPPAADAATQAPAAAAAGAPQPEQKSGPASLWAALTHPGASAAAPAQDSAPPQQPAPPRTASVAPSDGGSGEFAVQLAAPGSEAEAQSASTRLQSKYSGELGGLQPVIRKADLKGRTVYRVRVVGLSRADAIALCEKLKGAGGACFLARE